MFPARVTGLLAAALFATSLLTPSAVVSQPYPVPVPVPVPALTCWDDVRLFQSLANGPFDYCRAHLRYTPGALDCFQILDRVCLVWQAGVNDWTEARSTRARLPMRCPDGPEPPVCRRFDLQ